MKFDLILLLKLFIQVENEPLDSRAVGEANERGILQITPIAMRHVNEVYGTKYVVLDLTDNVTAMMIGELYLKILIAHFKDKEGRDVSLFNLVRMWNGGPNGYKKSSTLNYWQKFHAYSQRDIQAVLK